MTASEDLWAKLDALGEDAVRLRLAQGVYGERKKPLVLGWLRRREAEHLETQSRIVPAERGNLGAPPSPSATAHSNGSRHKTLYEGVVARLKNNPVVVALLLAVAVIGGAATLQNNIRVLSLGLFGDAVDRTAIRWSELLWNGETVVVNIADLPSHARGSLLVEGRSYSVRYQQQSCLWESSGPAQHRSGEVVENHFNRAGPSVKPYLTAKDSATATSECNSPRARKMVVLGLPVDVDRRGTISFGGVEHRIGELQVPRSGWRWPW